MTRARAAETPSVASARHPAAACAVAWPQVERPRSPSSIRCVFAFRHASCAYAVANAGCRFPQAWMTRSALLPIVRNRLLSRCQLSAGVCNRIRRRIRVHQQHGRIASQAYRQSRRGRRPRRRRNPPAIARPPQQLRSAGTSVLCSFSSEYRAPSSNITIRQRASAEAPSMSRVAIVTSPMPCDRGVPTSHFCCKVQEIRDAIMILTDCFNCIIIFCFTIMNRNLFPIYVIKPQDD